MSKAKSLANRAVETMKDGNLLYAISIGSSGGIFVVEIAKLIHDMINGSIGNGIVFFLSLLILATIASRRANDIIVSIWSFVMLISNGTLIYFNKGGWLEICTITFSTILLLCGVATIYLRRYT